MFKRGLINVFVKFQRNGYNSKKIVVNNRLFSVLTTKNSVTCLRKLDQTYTRALNQHSHRGFQNSPFEREEEEENTYEHGEGWTKAEDYKDAEKGKFENFNLSASTCRKLREMGINYLFPVQTSTFHPIYEGSDVIVQARTGSGKTMSYAIPLVEKLMEGNGSTDRFGKPKLLVLTPTRELANQVSQVISSLSNHIRVVPVFGGANLNTQEHLLRRGADVVVGTPGRLLDFISRGSLDLTQLKHVVLDEVDRMLDMGFADDVDQILRRRYNPNKKDQNPQTLLFSATVPTWVQKTAKKYLSRSLKMVDLIGDDTNKTATSVKHTALLCTEEQRDTAVFDLINKPSRNDDDGAGPQRCIVFCQTKREVDVLGRKLKDRVVLLHGDVTQYNRSVALRRFKSGEVSCMVATDVAARGLDIADVDLVIQCSPPTDVEAYIHRSGRTGRAGKEGASVVLYTPQEAHDVLKVEAVAKFRFEREEFVKNEETVKKDLIRSLRQMNQRVRAKCDGLKSELVDEFGEDALLSAAVALLAGYVPKSLINQRVGFCTLHLHQVDHPIHHPSQLFKLLNASLSNHVVSMVGNVRICTDREGVVFDIPSSKEDSFMEEWNRHFPSLKLSIPATLPSIEQNHRPYGSDTDRRRYSNENRNFFGASNGGYASRRRHAGHYADDARNDFYSSGRGSYRGGGPRNRNHTYPGRFNLLEE